MSSPVRRPARAAAVVLALLAFSAKACARDSAVEAELEAPSYSVDDLEGFVLGPDEEPPETRFVEAVSGSLTLKQLWPSSCCPAQQEAFDDAGYQAGYGSWFERPGRSDDPIDARPGYELVTSEVALFGTDQGASDAMEAWIEYHQAPELDPLPVEGLGEEARGYVGNPNAPAETVVLHFWRIGRLLLFLRVSAGTGTVPVAEVRELADRMDLRAS